MTLRDKVGQLNIGARSLEGSLGQPSGDARRKLYCQISSDARLYCLINSGTRSRDWAS